MTRIFIIAFVAILSVSSVAQAQLCPGYSVLVEQIDGDLYDPAEVVATRVRIRLSVDGGSAPPACAIQPVVISAEFATDPLATVFRNPESLLNVTGVYPGNSEANLIGFSLRLSLGARQRLVAGEGIELNVVDLSAGQFRRAGTYTSPIQVRVGTNAPVSLNLSTLVVPVMQLLASSADGQETINLGDPTNGATGSTTFYFRSNTGVQVSASSLNGGRLLHEGGTGHAIPYTLRVANTALNLSAGPDTLNLAFTSILPRASVIEASILPRPANDMPYAGVYRDTVTLNFTPF